MNIGIRNNECQELMYIRNTYYMMKMNEAQRILILVLAHANFFTHTNIVWTHVIHANILWTHAICLINAKLLWTYATHEPMHQCYPRHPRYLADSNTERNRVFKSQLSYCNKHSLIGTQHWQWTTAQNLINEGFWRNREHFLPDPFEILSNKEIERYPFLKYKSRIWDL